MYRFFQHLKTYKNYYLYNIAILLGGFIFGIYFYSKQPAANLSESSSSIIALLTGNYIQDFNYVNHHLLSSLFYIVIIYLFALSIVAIPFLSLLLFYKGIQFGFTSMIYIYVYDGKGILGIILTLLPYLIFEIIAYLISFCVAYEVSLSIILTTFIKKNIISFKEVILHLLNYLITALCFILLSILTQIYVLPTLFSLFNT